MNGHPPHPKDEEVRYRKLDAIDSKCGSLLAVTSILLVFISLPPVFDSVRLAHPVAFKLLAISLLSSCLVALFVLFFREHTSEQFVELRKFALNTAVGITAACCLAVIAVVAARL
jgi:hypothetical protein